MMCYNCWCLVLEQIIPYKFVLYNSECEYQLVERCVILFIAPSDGCVLLQCDQFCLAEAMS